MCNVRQENKVFCYTGVALHVFQEHLRLGDLNSLCLLSSIIVTWNAERRHEQDHCSWMREPTKRLLWWKRLNGDAEANEYHKAFWVGCPSPGGNVPSTGLSLEAPNTLEVEYFSWWVFCVQSCVAPDAPINPILVSIPAKLNELSCGAIWPSHGCH
jgi:hypothetical protein